MSAAPKETALVATEPPLAPHGARVEHPAAVREYLAVHMDGETFGVPLGRVREILRVPPITEVPRAPKDVLGIISVRGAITTVVDLRLRMGLVAAPVGPRGRILLVEAAGERLGLLVDRVDHVERFAEADIEYRTDLSGSTVEYIFGIGKRPRPEAPDPGPASPAGAHELVVLLDADALFGRP